MDEQSSGARTVMVVDDHRTFTELLRLGIDARQGLSCVGWATSVPEAMTRLETQRVDVVVMDYRIGEEDGVHATRLVTQRWPECAVVMLTAYPTRTLMERAAVAGASALMPKDGGLTDLLEVLTSARPGVFSVPPALLRILVAAPEQLRTVLTPRELEVLRHLAQGHDVRRVGRDLGMTVNTARGHVKAILAKLGAHSQLEAVATAWHSGLLETDDPPSHQAAPG